MKEYNIAKQITLLILVTLFGWTSFSAGEDTMGTMKATPLRNYTQMDRTKAMRLLTETFAQRNLPSPLFIGSWELSEKENADVQGVDIDATDWIIIAKAEAKSVLFFPARSGLPLDFPRVNLSNVIQIGPFINNYIVVSTVDIYIEDHMVFLSDLRGWNPTSSPILKKGGYLWFFGPGGIYLKSNQDTYIIPFMHPIEGFAKEYFDRVIEKIKSREKYGLPLHASVSVTVLDKGGKGILLEFAGQKLTLK